MFRYLFPSAVKVVFLVHEWPQGKENQSAVLTAFHVLMERLATQLVRKKSQKKMHFSFSTTISMTCPHVFLFSVLRFNSVWSLSIWKLVQHRAYCLHPSPAGFPFLQWNFGHHPHSSSCFGNHSDNCCVSGVPLLPSHTNGKRMDYKLHDKCLRKTKLFTCMLPPPPPMLRCELTTQSSAFCSSCHWSFAFSAHLCSSADHLCGHVVSSKQLLGSASSCVFPVYKWRPLLFWQHSAPLGPVLEPLWSGLVLDSREGVSACLHPYRYSTILTILLLFLIVFKNLVLKSVLAKTLPFCFLDFLKRLICILPECHLEDKECFEAIYCGLIYFVVFVSESKSGAYLHYYHDQ